MTRLLKLLCLPSLFSVPAIAADNFKATGQVRLDHKTVQSKKTQSGVKDVKSNTGSFTLVRARLIGEGNLDNEISYRMKLNFDKSHIPDTYANDSISKALLEAKIVHKWSDAFSLEFGRLELNVFSVENSYGSLDLYSTSQLYATRKPTSTNGLAAVTKFFGQTMSLQLGNSPGYDSSGSGDYKVENDDMVAGLYWTGTLIGGMLRPVASFVNTTRRNYDANTKTTSEKYSVQILGVGTSIILGDLSLDLEVDQFKTPEYKTNKDADLKTGSVNINTQIASIRYQIKPININTILKWSGDRETYNNDPAKDKIDTSKISLAAEWRPNANSFRYHANIESSNSKLSKDGKADVKTDIITYLIGAGASI